MSVKGIFFWKDNKFLDKLNEEYLNINSLVKCMVYVKSVIVQLQSVTELNYIKNTRRLLHGKPLPFKVVKSGFSCTICANSIPSGSVTSARVERPEASSKGSKIIGHFISHTAQNSAQRAADLLRLWLIRTSRSTTLHGVLIEICRFSHK
jgi:hypothetical protein